MVMVNMRDVTERRRVEKALAESEDRYRIIFETTACATVIIDEDMTLSLVNNEFERLSGRSKEEIEGRANWIEFVDPRDVERVARYHYQRRVDPDGAPRNYEFQFLRRSGEKRDHIHDERPHSRHEEEYRIPSRRDGPDPGGEGLEGQRPEVPVPLRGAAPRPLHDDP